MLIESSLYFQFLDTSSEVGKNIDTHVPVSCKQCEGRVH
jgi:hypothetical protein